MATGISLSTIGVDAPVVVEAARRAEAAGFASIWCYDHLSGVVLGGDRSLDVWTTLGAIAGATERVGVGPLVANATTRHPVQVALAVATLQSLAGDRVSLGLGAGAGAGSPFAAELEMFGLPAVSAAERRDRLVETIGYLRALWAGADRFDGRWSAFSDVRGMLLPSPPPPIIVGANGPRMAAVAGRLADGVNLHSSEENLAGLIAAATEAAATAGRASPAVSVEGPHEPEWIDEASPTRRALAGQGVSDVMVAWRAGLGLEAIDAASRWL